MVPSPAPPPPAAGVPDSVEWDERYGGRDQVWSGEPNGALVAEVADLDPGRVLDVGCGEGADAVWLAAGGWEVAALDVSGTALERARRHADAAGVTIGWMHAALLEAAQDGRLDARGYHLVSAQYPALRTTPGHRAEHVLAAAVAPGGTLLVVHHVADPEHARAHGFDLADYVSPADVRDHLRTDWPPDTWDVALDERRPRTVNGGSGAHHTHDVVLRARRLR